MKENPTFNAEESLRLIDRMIKTAQEQVEDSSFYYLIWGWAVLIAAVFNYCMLQMQSPQAFLGWAVLMPLTALITIIYSIKNKKHQPKIKSYVNDLIGYVLTSFIVSLAVVLFHIPLLRIYAYPMIMLTYGSWLFISGGALRFKPLIAGGIMNWVLGVIAFYVSFEMQLLLLSAAVLVGYIIPGHLLRNKFKNSGQKFQTA